MNVYLIGFRGTGKTTVAQCLSRRLGRRAIDADEWLEQKAGRTIKEIFATEGEVAFRDLESEVIADLAAGQGAILALGGGAVLREQNRTVIRGSGRVVWLQARPETVSRRLSTDSTTPNRRPDLTASGGYTEIVELMAQRAPIYRQCADLIVDTEGKTPEQVADEIVSLLGERPGGR